MASLNFASQEGIKNFLKLATRRGIIRVIDNLDNSQQFINTALPPWLRHDRWTLVQLLYAKPLKLTLLKDLVCCDLYSLTLHLDVPPDG